MGSGAEYRLTPRFWMLPPPPHPPGFSTPTADALGGRPLGSQWGPQGQLGRVPGGEVGGQGHQGCQVHAHAQPDGQDPQQESAAGGGPCPLDVPLGPSLVGLWRWCSGDSGIPSSHPANRSLTPPPPNTPMYSFICSRNIGSSYCGSGTVGHWGYWVTNKNIYIYYYMPQF